MKVKEFVKKHEDGIVTSFGMIFMIAGLYAVTIIYGLICRALGFESGAKESGAKE